MVQELAGVGVHPGDAADQLREATGAIAAAMKASRTLAESRSAASSPASWRRRRSATASPVGTLFFTLLDDGVGFVDATRRSLWLEIGLFLASALLSFLLPFGPVRRPAPATRLPPRSPLTRSARYPGVGTG